MAAPKISEWRGRVGYLPAALDLLAFEIVIDRGIGEANAVAEALVTVRDLVKTGKTAETRQQISGSTRAALRETLDEWELIRAIRAAEDWSEERWAKFDGQAGALVEAADSLVKATVHSPIGKPGGPGLWKHKGLQLPAYIQHIAKAMMKDGKPESSAIATAVAAVKRWAAGGGKVDANTQAAAKKALAEWEALKASHGKAQEAWNPSLVRSVDRLQHVVSEAFQQRSLGARMAHRETVIEALLRNLSAPHPVIALRSAEELLGEAAFDRDFDYSEPELVALAEAASADLSPKGRAKMAAKGHAMSDGSYPIPNVEFLKKAISAFGRAKNKAAAKAWIVKRAKALGATGLIPDGWDVRESALYVSELLGGDLATCRVLREALGYGATPIRGKESGSKGKFHGMHGMEKAVRRRSHIPTSDPHPVLDSINAKGSLTEGSYTDELHPRVSQGPGGGEFASKGGAQPQGQPKSQAAPVNGQVQGGDPAVQQQLDERLTQLGYQGGGASLKEFQSANGIAPTGQIDGPTTAALQKATPVDQAQKQIDQSLQFGRTNAGTQTQVNRVSLAHDRLQSIGFADDPSGVSMFQKQYDLPVSGKLDPSTLAAIASVYTNNARSAGKKKVDFTGIAGPGAKVTSSAGAAPGSSKTGIKEAFDALIEDAVVIASSSRLIDPQPYGSSDDRQPGGDDIDLDERPQLPPGFREGDGTHVCQTCPHFAKGGIVIPNHFGACMLYTYPVDRLDVCDDWTTLTPQDANVAIFEGKLIEAETAADVDGIVVARARLASARAAAREVTDRPLHPAHKDRVEEAGLFDEAKHPRGRGGKWAFTHALRALSPGQSHTHRGVKVTHTGVRDGERMYEVHTGAGESQKNLYGERVPADAVHQALRRKYEAQATKDAGFDDADLKGAQDRARKEAPPEAHLTGPTSSHPDYPGTGRSPAVSRAQQVAQDRHRAIHNKGVEDDEKRGGVDYEGVKVPIDPQPRDIKPFEHDRPYVVSGPAHKDGNKYVVVNHTGQGKRAHPVSNPKKPGSKMSRRSGHDLLNEALALDSLNDAQRAFLTEQSAVLEAGGEPDEILDVFVETLLEEAA